MKIENRKIPSQMDQLPLSTLIYIPDSSPHAILQLAHGMSEHKERYIPFIEYLCELGYVCILHDHRGHGESIMSREDLGYFYENGAEAVVEDLHQLNVYIKTRYPDLPLILLGHSMGSLIARAYLKKYDITLDGLIISGSPSANPLTKIVVPLVKLLIKIKSGHAKGTLFHYLAFANYNKKFENPSSPNEWICSNKDVVREYDACPLCGFIFTLNGFYNLFSLLNRAYNKNNWKVMNPDLPIWFISGEEDPCLINYAKFKKAVELLRHLGYQNVTYQLYPDMRHEILNETDKGIVYQDIANKLSIYCKQEDEI